MKRLKKVIMVIMIAVMLLSIGATSLAAPANVEATRSTATVKINDSTVAFEAYTIDGFNYFKLRDIAQAFVGSPKRFSVDWDGSLNAIFLRSNELYSQVGGELTVSGGTSPVKAVPTAATIYFDGSLLNAKAYTIGDFTYFKLRDIAATMNFDVSYEEATKVIQIDMSQGYTA